MTERQRLPQGRVRLEAPTIRVRVAFLRNGARGPVFTATYQGQEIARSVRPFYDAARALRAAGAPYWQDFETVLVSGIVSMRGMIGWAADHTTTEPAAGGLHRRRWVPYPTKEDVSDDDADNQEANPGGVEDS